MNEKSEKLLSRNEWLSLGRTVMVPNKMAADVFNDSSPFDTRGGIRFVFSEDQTKETIEVLREEQQQHGR